MKNTTWYNVKPGDVVSFMYKGQGDEAKSARRIVICLDPRYQYRKKTTNRIVEYFIGLEIFNTSKPNLTPTVIKQLFELLSENIDDVLTETGGQARMERIYAELKDLLKREPNLFRTYFFRECRRRRVFIEDKYDRLNSLQVKQVTKKLINESDEGDSVIGIGDDLDEN